MKPLLKTVLLSTLALISLSSVQAAVVTAVGGGSATASIFVSTTPGADPVYDLRGAVVLNVFDDATYLGDVTLFDPTGGTDPGFATLPFGNPTMYGTALAQFNVGSANFSGASFVPALLIPVTFAEIIPASVTDPALLALINGGPISFSFDFLSQTDFAEGTLFQFNMTGGAGPQSEVPEPATMGLAGAALIGIVAFRRRKSS